MRCRIGIRQFSATQQYIEQIVIAHLEQHHQGGRVGLCQVFLVAIQESGDDQVIFQQSPACAPTQTRTVLGGQQIRILVCTRRHGLHHHR